MCLLTDMSTESWCKLNCFVTETAVPNSRLTLKYYLRGICQLEILLILEQFVTEQFKLLFFISFQYPHNLGLGNQGSLSLI